ncbi:MAG: hypothetical protein IKV82_03140 [Akkermansia sp.]|nr:hypothetical protein [Akkermansia sp.]
MKLHLPRFLAAAVLAACVSAPAFAAESSSSIVTPPEGYEVKTLNSATTLSQYRSNTSGSSYVMYLNNASHIDYTYTDWSALDTGSTAFINGGNFFFSTKLPVNNSYSLDTLHFIGTTEIVGSVGKAFSNVGELGFANLSHLEFNGLKDGAIGLSQGGSLTISNIKGDDTYDVEFNKNKAAGNYVIEAGDSGSITMENNGSIRFADNNAFTYDDLPIGTEWWLWDPVPSVVSQGVMQAHTITMNNNEDIVFNCSPELIASGRAIHVTGSDGSLTMKDNGKILISAFADNRAVDVSGSVTMLNNKSISIDSNFGGIYASADVIISNTEGAVSFTDNCLLSDSSGQWNGGGIEANNIVMDANGSVIFSGNSAKSQDHATTYGGAIYVYSALQISNTVGDVEFSGNSAYVQGGAIYSQGDVTFQDNQGNIVFESNKAEFANGGAIAAVDNTNNVHVLISGTEGDITFKGNESFRGGAAVFVPHGNITLSGNMGDITFTQNRTEALETQNSYGGAIYAKHGTVTINDNQGTVTFSDNRNLGDHINHQTGNTNYDAALGGAIYATNLEIRNNDSVVFENNMEIVWSQTERYRMRSLYVTDNASLSAAKDHDITFSDSVYIGGNLVINADHTSATGTPMEQEGDIIFHALNVEQRLNTAISQFHDETGGYDVGKAFDTEVAFARTSVIGGLTTVNGGRLRVENDAIFKSCGIVLNDESKATLRIVDAKVVNVAAADGVASSIRVNKGTTLEAIGHSTIEGGAVSFADGAEWSFGLSDKNFDGNAALTYNGSVAIEGGLTLTVDVSNSNMNEKYCLYQGAVNSAQWTATNITVNGQRDAAGAGFDDLVWQDGKLYYVSSMVWGNNAGSWLWNTTDLNWQNGKAYADGMNVKFTDTAAGEVLLSGKLAAGAVTVVNSEGNDYTFSAADAEGSLSGAMDLVKRGTGALTLNLANEYTGTTKLEEGTLNLHHDKALGGSALETSAGTTLGVGNGAHIVLEHDDNKTDGAYQIKGNVKVDAGATLEIKGKGGDGYAASNTEVEGTLQYTDTSSDLGGNLTGAGKLQVLNSKVTLTGSDATKDFKGNISIVGPNASLTSASSLHVGDFVGGVDGRQRQVALLGGALIVQDTLGMVVEYGNKLTMASGNSEQGVATITANQVIIASNAELSVSLLAPPLTAIPVEDAQVGGITLNTTVGGVINTGKLKLDYDSTLVLNQSHLDLNGGCLTLEMKKGQNKINLVLTLDGQLLEDSSVLLFSDVGTLSLGFWDAMDKYNADQDVSYTFDARDYFSGEMIGDATKLVFHNGTLSMTGIVIPEPATTTLSLLALAAMAARRRRASR